MSADFPTNFDERFATLGLDEATLQASHSETLIPTQLADFAEPVNRMRTLPRLGLGSQLGTVPDLRVTGTLGEGGMGLVRLATQVALDREVAVKTLRTSSDDSAPKLLQEAYVTGRLEHPNIVPIYTLGRDENDIPLIVMKRIEGVSWAEVLHDADALPSEKVDLTWHLEILIQVCNALRYAHSRHIIHRDIKPENVMIGPFGEVYLLDWGIAISIDPDGSGLLPHRNDVKGLAGTPHYMAPEMTDNDASDHDERTDVYLLGATLHELLTGAPRHVGKNLFEVMKSAFESTPFEYDESLPQELAQIANRAMSQAKEERFSSVDEFRDAVAAFLDHRASLELSNQALQTVETIRPLLDKEVWEEAESLQIHDLFTECRFACRQALREWESNESAATALRECLELMTRFAIGRRDLLGAQAALAELDDPPAELAEAVTRLAAELADEKQDVERLRAFEADQDLRTEAGYRSLFVAIVGVFWAATCFWVYFRQGGVDIDAPARNLVVGTLRAVIIGFGAIALFHRRLFANAANRRITYLLMATLTGLVAFRIITYAFKVPEVPSQAYETASYGLMVIAAGVVSDLRIAAGALIYFTTAASAWWLAEDYLVVLGFAHLAFFLWLAWIWSPKQMEKSIQS